MRDAGVSFEVAETREPGDAVGLAERAAREYGVVVAAGGDGTLHEVVNGLLRAGTGAVLGVLPLGSGDDFVKMLPSRDSVDRLAQGTARPYDAGRIVAGATRYFANGMDIGFGAHASRNLHQGAAIPHRPWRLPRRTGPDPRALPEAPSAAAARRRAGVRADHLDDGGDERPQLSAAASTSARMRAPTTASSTC